MTTKDQPTGLKDITLSARTHMAVSVGHGSTFTHENQDRERGRPAHINLFMMIALWLDSFKTDGGRRIDGIAGRIVGDVDDPARVMDRIGRLTLGEVPVDIVANFVTDEDETAVVLTMIAGASGAEDRTKLSMTDGRWIVVPGQRVDLYGCIDSIMTSFDMALAPGVARVHDMHHVMMSWANEGENQGDPSDIDLLLDCSADEPIKGPLTAQQVAETLEISLAVDLKAPQTHGTAATAPTDAARLSSTRRHVLRPGDDCGFAGDPSENVMADDRDTGADVDGPHRRYDVRDVRRAMASGGDEASSRMPMLRRLAQDSETVGRRNLRVADAATLSRLDALAARAPHLAEASMIARRHAAASMHTGMPMTLPPILLLGEGGIGKTWYLSRLGEALGVPFRSHPLSGSTLSEALQGSNAIYRNAHPGLVASTLIDETIANPLIFIDEFDKPAREGGDGYRPFYVLLEPEGARQFKDEYLGFDLDASRISWVVAANDITQIPAIILDRMTVVETPVPSAGQMSAICDSIERDLNGNLFGGYFKDGLADEVRGELVSRHPRGARKALQAAMTAAAAAGRRRVDPEDLPPAPAPKHRPMGFLR